MVKDFGGVTEGNRATLQALISQLDLTTGYFDFSHGTIVGSFLVDLDDIVALENFTEKYLQSKKTGDTWRMMLFALPHLPLSVNCRIISLMLAGLTKRESLGFFNSCMQLQGENSLAVLRFVAEHIAWICLQKFKDSNLMSSLMAYALSPKNDMREKIVSMFSSGYLFTDGKESRVSREPTLLLLWARAAEDTLQIIETLPPKAHSQRSNDSTCDDLKTLMKSVKGDSHPTIDTLTKRMKAALELTKR